MMKHERLVPFLLAQKLVLCPNQQTAFARLVSNRHHPVWCVWCVTITLRVVLCALSPLFYPLVSLVFE
jgi:hypothetical protein